MRNNPGHVAILQHPECWIVGELKADSKLLSLDELSAAVGWTADEIFLLLEAGNIRCDFVGENLRECRFIDSRAEEIREQLSKLGCKLAGGSL